MRTCLFWMVMALSGAAYADDLAEANKLLESKSYPQAIDLLGKLAGAGNAAAELRLGQVYWYGEGVPADRPRGEALFAQAAAAGNKDAAAAMGLGAARQQHLADIDYWTARYDGADLRPACATPAIAPSSTNNGEIKQTEAGVAAWQACYNGFAKRMADALPVGKQIPPGVLDLMSDAEVEQAKLHLGQVYSRVAADAKDGADKIVAAYGAWRDATAAYVNRQNELAREMERKRLPSARGDGPMHDVTCWSCGTSGGYTPGAKSPLAR